MKITTCQICERAIKANTGVIAHHGYQRPGEGWQTGSCFGARALPLQISRDKLGEWVVALRAMRDGQIAARQRVQNETQAVALEYTERVKSRDPWGKRETISFAVARDTWDEMKALHPAGFADHWETFDAVKDRDLSKRAAEIDRTGREIAHQQARFDKWKPTSAEVA